MNWRGPIKQISVELPEDLHLQVKSEAPRRSARTTQKAYKEALEAWLKPASGAPDSNATEVSAADRDLIAWFRNTDEGMRGMIRNQIEIMRNARPQVFGTDSRKDTEKNS